MTHVPNGWPVFPVNPKPTPLPKKAMRIKKAEAWLAAHPDVDPVAFWSDQSDKTRKSGQSWLYVGVGLLILSGVLQIVSAVTKLMGHE